MSLKIKLWGVRGSLPAPLAPQQIEDKIRQCLTLFQETDAGGVEEFMQTLPPHAGGGYGGHTMCVQVSSPSTSLIIDGGSGIRRMGEQLAVGPAGLGRGEIHILLTHFHWDHLIGLPFFIPLFIPGNRVHFYAVQEDLENRIRTVFQKPFFPVPFEALGAKISFHTLSARKKFDLGGISVTPYELDHPDPCWGYRFEYRGKVYAHAVDSECTRLSRSELGEDVALYQNADLLLFDAQYSFLEATEKVNWGHSSAPIGLDLALREKVKKVLFVHHDPAASDAKISQIEEQTRRYFQLLKRQAEKSGESLSMLEWEFAREGVTLEL